MIMIMGHGLLLRLWLWATKRSCLILSGLSALSIIGKLVNIILFCRTIQTGLIYAWFFPVHGMQNLGYDTTMQVARVLLFLASVHACLSSSLFGIAYSGKAHPTISIPLILDPILIVKLNRLKTSIQANALVHYPTSIDP